MMGSKLKELYEIIDYKTNQIITISNNNMELKLKLKNCEVEISDLKHLIEFKQRVNKILDDNSKETDRYCSISNQSIDKNNNNLTLEIAEFNRLDTAEIAQFVSDVLFLLDIPKQKFAEHGLDISEQYLKNILVSPVAWPQLDDTQHALYRRMYKLCLLEPKEMLSKFSITSKVIYNEEEELGMDYLFEKMFRLRRENSISRIVFIKYVVTSFETHFYRMFEDSRRVSWSSTPKIQRVVCHKINNWCQSERKVRSLKRICQHLTQRNSQAERLLMF